MSLAPVGTLAIPALSDLVDGLAARSGSWVMVERFGSVVCHGTGASPCPPALTEALLTKVAATLRQAVVWSRGGPHLRGTIDGLSVTTAELGEGATAWAVGGKANHLHDQVDLLSSAVLDDAPIHDAVVEELLHPRGPSRRGQAAEAVLVVLRSEIPVRALARLVVAASPGTTARVHVDDDSVIVALPPDGEPSSLLRLVARRCPSVIGGTCRVDSGASDWVTAAELAGSALVAAQALGVTLGDPTDPTVGAELVVQHAQGSVQSLLRMLSDSPMQRLEEHDGRGAGELVASLAAWCRSGFDTASAAGQLHIHVNTMRYRLKRAEQISGLDLGLPRQRLALQLLLAV